jgi:hypothetical protein
MLLGEFNKPAKQHNFPEKERHSAPQYYRNSHLHGRMASAKSSSARLSLEDL